MRGLNMIVVTAFFTMISSSLANIVAALYAIAGSNYISQHDRFSGLADILWILGFIVMCAMYVFRKRFSPLV